MDFVVLSDSARFYVCYARLLRWRYNMHAPLSPHNNASLATGSVVLHGFPASTADYAAPHIEKS